MLLKKKKLIPVLQRLGYLLEVTGFLELAKPIEHELSKRKIEYIPLQPDLLNKTGDKIVRWKLILNEMLELI